MNNLKIRWFDESAGEFIKTDTLEKELMHYFSVVDGQLKLFVEGMDCDVTGMRYDEIKSDPELFIGIKDKDGVDVYAGDIIEFLDQEDQSNESNGTYFEDVPNRGVVFWDESESCFDVTNRDCVDRIDAFFEFKVIGNKHQNKDLLETN